MSLTNHRDVPSFNNWVAGEGRDTVRDDYNANLDDMETQLQAIEDELEDALDTLHSAGVITGMAPTIGSGLNVDVAVGTALIGYQVACSAQSVTVDANANPGYIYFCQDGTFVVNTTGVAPTTKDNFLYRRFISGAATVTSIYDDTNDAEKILPVYLQVATGTFERVSPGVSLSADFYVDHESQVSFEMIGKLDLQVSSGFTVKHLYPGLISYASDTPETPPEEDTPTGFWMRLTSTGEYVSGSYPSAATITYIRKGFAYA